MFQSTHSRGVRPMFKLTVPLVLTVSIHALAGSATQFLVFPCINLYVSIHALAGSATRTFKSFTEYVYGFNPRTRGECDPEVHVISTFSDRFQSTHSRGVRPICWRPSRSISSFNPRTRGECDKKYHMIGTQQRRFQSTHSRGVRLEQGGYDPP